MDKLLSNLEGGYRIDIEIYYGLELDVCKKETNSGNFYHHFEDSRNTCGQECKITR